MKNKFVFILSPPFSGSTLVTSILESDTTSVSLNNPENNKEGQFVDEVKEHMRETPWSTEKVTDWKFVKKVWMEKWDTDKAYLLEKSPPNICRALEIEENFDPVFFILLIRNPYAFVEGKLKRDLRIRGSASTEEAINFWITTATWQKNNIEKLKQKYFIPYEILTKRPNKFRKDVLAFLPQLEIPNLRTMTFNLKSNKGGSSQHISNLNKSKIKKLSTTQKEIINEQLSKNQDLLSFFNYRTLN